VADVLHGGLAALSEYLSAHVVSCLVPAFFIAGAIAVFVRQGAVLRYFGAGAKRVLSYGVASVSGAILAVCSCTILPLFAGIRQRGAGLGPAITFLFSGPAINVLAVVYSARLLGYDIGAARAVGAIVLAIVIGLLMATIFRRSELKLFAERGDLVLPDEAERPLGCVVAFFVAMVALLVAASSIALVISISANDGNSTVVLSGKIVPAAIAFLLTAVVVAMAARWFSRGENAQWMRETWALSAKLIPVLLVGVFLAGVLRVVVPEQLVQSLVGSNTPIANLVASLFGATMYFSTLTEVPAVRMLMDLGMDRGPALSLLLAGPSLSLPSIIVIWRVVGFSRTLVYTALVVVFSSAAGWTFGHIA
jgi:uncharacterized membrane protein YraQ (UPF0718 family)